jgi:hypothetical protein
MFIAHCVIAVLYAVMLTFSGILKLQLKVGAPARR